MGWLFQGTAGGAVFSYHVSSIGSGCSVDVGGGGAFSALAAALRSLAAEAFSLASARYPGDVQGVCRVCV